MTFPRLLVEIDRETSEENVLLVRSPAVGLYSDYLETGAFLAGGGMVGRLTVLNRAYDLVLPVDVWGQVGKLAIGDKMAPVEYGQVLFHLIQRGFEGFGEGKTLGDGVAEGVSIEGTQPLPSPTDGIFYRKPNPDAAPYVNVGDRVTQGQTLGLVEVMKCFNPIQYGGPGLPPEAEIVKILAQDGAEIKAEQVLFLVRE